MQPEPEMKPTPPSPSPAVRLFLTSFLILFTELVCIRWVPAHVRFLSFFTNFMLLASFLGVGVGVLAARRWDPPLRAFSVLMLVLVGLVAWNRFEFRFYSSDVLFFGASEKQGAGDYYLSLPLLFSAVTLVFVPLGAWLGRLLVELPPLQAYAIDIAGAMAGVATYTLVAYLSLGPGVWFGLIALVLFMLKPRRESFFPVGMLVVVAALTAQMGSGSIWSPYYRISHYPNHQGGHEIDINGIGHQSTARSSEKESFYFRVHDLFGKAKPFRKVLVIGAGSGSDVAIALENGAQAVDAVEIDPMIAQLGGELNPQRPYSDPRTRVHVGDGRAFLRTSTESYDLIIFALTDSTALTSAYASLRLESFLYTSESLATAKKRLAPGGMMVLYNYYRHDWIVQRLAGMLETTFGQPPFVTTYGHSGRAAVLLAGPRLAELDPALDKPYVEAPGLTADGRGQPLRIVGMGRMAGDPTIPPARDDWPFLYLRTPAIPAFYLGSLALIGAIALLFVAIARPREGRKFDAHFFFLGAAFMLLETRSLVTFALLFGTTWIVNSLVFFAILGSVLIAIMVNARFTLSSVKPIYGLLFAALGANYLVPAELLLGIEDPMLRYTLASALTFSPIFLANVVFSRSFKDTAAADTAFGSNLLGAMAGGMLEYLDLLTGTQALLIPVILFYVLALTSWRARAD